MTVHPLDAAPPKGRTPGPPGTPATSGTPGTPGTRGSRAARRSLLDVAAEVLVADPSASLAQVAEAAGIGRTTLHKQYATREDLLRAVGHRVIDLWEQVAETASADDPDGGLRAAVEAMIPIGPQLAFLWRTPSFDHDQDMETRWNAFTQQTLAILKRAQDRGVISAAVPDWWLLSTFHSVIYIASERVQLGHLARLDAPGLALSTLLHGIAPQAPQAPQAPNQEDPGKRQP
jgi:AcrR family transcriptional regulator